MAHFHKVPGGERISGGVLTVNSGSITIGLWSPADHAGQELTVRSNNANVSVTRAAMAGASRNWTVAGSDGQTARLQAITSNNHVWDEVHIVFRTGNNASNITVLPITKLVDGRDPVNGLVPTSIPQIDIVDVASFRAGDAGNKPRFTVSPAKQARIGVFACSKGTATRAAVLLLPATGTPDRVLIGITHGFGQNAQYYGNLGWSDPLSVPLIQDVARRFVIARWGAQMLASRKQMALVMPVRARGAGGELGPFGSDGEFVKQALNSIALATGGAFRPATVEAFTFSSGIHELTAFLGNARGQLSIGAVYNLDPAGAHSAPDVRGASRKQFLSGQTGGPKAGFEYLPESRWENEPYFHNRSGADLFNYLHNHCLPKYCLHLGIQLT